MTTNLLVIERCLSSQQWRRITLLTSVCKTLLSIFWKRFLRIRVSRSDIATTSTWNKRNIKKKMKYIWKITSLSTLSSSKKGRRSKILKSTYRSKRKEEGREGPNCSTCLTLRLNCKILKKSIWKLRKPNKRVWKRGR